jgi:hypothetical protein
MEGHGPSLNNFAKHMDSLRKGIQHKLAWGSDHQHIFWKYDTPALKILKIGSLLEATLLKFMEHHHNLFNKGNCP